jgi:hypothetical protein
MQGPLLAADFRLQLAARTDVADALACPHQPGLDEIAAPGERSDRDEVEAGLIDQIVVQMIDRLGIARRFGEPHQPFLDGGERRSILAAHVVEAKQREGNRLPPMSARNNPDSP